MKLIVSAGVAIALALSACALSGTPASAFQVPAVAVSQDSTVKVGWREDRHWVKRREKCHRVRYKCYMRHGWSRQIMRDCAARRGCAR